MSAGLQVGDHVTVRVGPVAHGGHCVARHENQVIFVRHALPGEEVVACITERGPKGRYLRADTTTISTPSAHRRVPPCPYAGSCGGCAWQHATSAYQLSLKTDVLKEQFRRLAKIDPIVAVESLPGDADGLGWRTRVEYSVDQAGRVGFLRHRSADVVAVDQCLIAHPLVRGADVTDRLWPDVERVRVAASVAAGTVDVSSGELSGETLLEHADGRMWHVSAEGFWQVHPLAAETLIAVMCSQLQPKPVERAIDLYSGVGLFAGAVAKLVGSSGRVDAVEGNRASAQNAASNLVDLPAVHVHCEPVERYLRRRREPCDLVVLDPPRVGAGAAVSTQLARLAPRAVCYISCDPAALARDTATFAGLGYQLTAIRAFDLFPNTQHIEAVALFERAEL